MTRPPLASGFIYQEEKLGKPAYICISIQIVPCLQALSLVIYLSQKKHSEYIKTDKHFLLNGICLDKKI